ncbi:hypothetical protein CEXT_708371 [Caerostris extrusa]|uniref:Uncharacterized protein n=1 Tax=Caerostris extrusa TaxID=172846 RepID=A0AAV4SUV7_CAEEX|nr:hypothetical protein CEXT_708371 [Caerostris extrusa]
MVFSRMSRFAEVCRFHSNRAVTASIHWESITISYDASILLQQVLGTEKITAGLHSSLERMTIPSESAFQRKCERFKFSGSNSALPQQRSHNVSLLRYLLHLRYLFA